MTVEGNLLNLDLNDGTSYNWDASGRVGILVSQIHINDEFMASSTDVIFEHSFSISHILMEQKQDGFPCFERDY